jgi:hypothetical protein
MTTQEHTPNNDHTSFVYGPHDELSDLIETLQTAIDNPRRRRDAIEAALEYLLNLYQALDALSHEMNERKAREGAAAE